MNSTAKLTESQKKFLRREAHSLKPVVAVGDKGVTPTLLQELAAALDHHELIKVRVRAGDRTVRDEIIAKLSDQANATLITRIGNIATLYRPRKKKPTIILPG